MADTSGNKEGRGGMVPPNVGQEHYVQDMTAISGTKKEYHRTSTHFATNYVKAVTGDLFVPPAGAGFYFD